jgi:diguanylate cyclase (GGDEF)-like protein
MTAGRRATRFRHDRLRDTVLAAVPAERLRNLRLGLARRLAGQPELYPAAAEQYLPVIDAVHDPDERRRAAGLLHRAAEQNMWIGESLPAESKLSAAVRLSDDPATLIQLHTKRHTALYRLGRLAEADEVYQTVVRLSTEPYDRAEATRVQISSLTNRGRPDDAIDLGLDLLRRLGWAVPDSRDQLDTEVEAGLEWLYPWIGQTSDADDLRPDVTVPIVVATGALISRMMPACFFRDQTTMAWLALAAARVWAEQGPTRTLLGAMSHLPWVLIGRRQDYRTGHRLLRRLIAVGEKRDYEPDLSEARFLYSVGPCHWFEPVEHEPPHGRRAREGLIRGGELQSACYAYSASICYVDVTTTMDDYAAEIDSALAFAKRTSNAHAMGLYQPYRWLVAVLRGEPSSAGEEEVPGPVASIPSVAGNMHIARALAAAILDDPPSLAQHSQAAMELRYAFEALYGDWQAHLTRAIALVDRVRSAPGHSAELAELDGIIDWMAQRASDTPANFGHMVSLLRAERAWALRDFRAAIHAFDSALRHAGHRPWHRAYIAERSAKFMLAHGLDCGGWSLLVEAREAYRAWGAQAKVDQLGRAYPGLDIPTEPPTGAAGRASISGGAIDMLAILSASRALSSETSVSALRAKLVEILSAMTGATEISLLVWDVQQHRWLAATDDGNGSVPRDHEHRIPRSVIRYVERTREPLIVADAVRDDRFFRDPYFIDRSVCSVLAAPVISRGTLQAILLLENHLISDAFPAERLEGVMLIAGQLAISLDNALIYASLEQKVTERTEQLAHANERLAQLSITDPLTGLANRRRLDQSLRDEWAQMKRSLAPLSLAMVDIDHFKRYNDLHGHPAGDRCLQRVAERLARTVRDTDLVARYGGEEFAVIMPHTEFTAAHEAAERLRVAIADLAEPMIADEMVTASVGVATLRDPERQTTEQLIERADTALYQAKRAGRNRVSSADNDRPPPNRPA